MAQSEQDVLVQRLGRYPAERYPVQHATTQFHLGTVFLHAGDTGAALDALTAASDVFGQVGMRLEQGKVGVMLGIALRTAGRCKEAISAFTDAGALLARLDQPAEQAAAAYNLALVHQDTGDLQNARTAWTEARHLFLVSGYPAQAGAAARDHGASLLAAGEVATALPLLEQATELAERAGDGPGTGASANVLGLAHLAAQNSSAAVSVLRRALAESPRAVRSADHAMVKANLALAYEQAGDEARARLAARQSLAVPDAAPPVRAQARQLLARLPGSAQADLMTVLDTEPSDRRVAVLREEMLRAAELAAGQRSAVIRGFLDGLLARPGVSYDLAESLLHVVLELPPRTYGLLVGSLVDACAGRPEQDVERLRAVIGSALARFALPQWQRLAASLNAAAVAAGQAATWK